MATYNNITTRQDFTNYCLRRLGAPVIQINVDEDQISDRIDDAIQYWQDYHFDGTQKVYWIHTITNQDVSNMYLDATQALASDGSGLQIIGISRIFPLSDSQATINMFDLRYQLRLNELYDFTSASMINYTMTQQHLRSLELQFTGEVPIRFNRATQRLFIDWAWGDLEAPTGQVVISECYAAVDPAQSPKMWDDRWLKRYATALIKQQWGSNMSKYGGLQLPGGVTLNGKDVFDEASDEIDQLHKEMQNEYSAPCEWFLN